MHIGLLRVHAHIPASRSLKDKRQVLQSIKQRLKNGFNVSVAETGQQNDRQHIEISLVMVAVDRDHIHETFRRVVGLIEARENLQVLEESVEFL